MPLNYKIGLVRASSTNPTITYEFGSCSLTNDIGSHIPSKELCQNFLVNPMTGKSSQSLILYNCF